MNRFHRVTQLSFLFALALLAFLIGPGAGNVVQAQGGGDVRGPKVGPAIKPVSMDKDLRTLPKPTKDQGGKHGTEVLLPTSTLHAPLLPSVPDPVRQTSMPAIKAPSQIQNFIGAGGDDPPDDNGAVGIKYFAQTTNFNVGFFEKATGNATSVVNMNTFWSNAGGGTGTPCDTNNNGDPVALYDGLADRFIITDFAWSNFTDGPYYECIAVAKTSDPISGGWWLYALRADDGSNPYLPDYPKLGVWRDGYYMMADMFDLIPCSPTPCTPGEVFKFVRVWALNRANMISGGAMSPISFDVSGRFSMVPTNWNGIGTPPPVGTPNYFGEVDYQANSNKIHIFRFHADFATPSNSWFGTSMGNPNPTDVTVPAFNAVSLSVPQKGTSAVLLDTLGNRLMHQFQYRNIGGTESLWAVHAVDAGSGVNGVRWYQLDVTGGTIAGSQVQAGTFSPDSTHRWMPHLAADRFGNMALGYSASDSSIYPDIRYTGRLAGDAANTLQSEATLFSSSKPFIDCAPLAPATTCVARWGDYASMEVDPVDDCTFWFTTEYVDNTGAAVTRIGSFRFNSSCSADVAVSKSGPATVVAGTNLTYNLTVTNNGPVGAGAVTLTDSTPPSTTFVSFAQNTGPAFNCSTPSVGFAGTVTCTANALANAASATFSFVVHVSPGVPNGSTLSNTASVTTTSNDPNSANNSSTAMVNVMTRADLSVTKSQASNLVIADINQTYTLKIVNNGPSDAQNVTLSDPTPTNTTFVSLTQYTGPASFTCTTPPVGGTGNVSCTIATLAVGAWAPFTMVVRISPVDTSSITNTASATASTVDPNPANNSATVTAVDSIKEYKQAVLTDLIALRSTVTDKQVGQKLDQAIKHLSNSLDPSLWVDGNVLDAKRGDKVFSEEKDAAVFMSDLIKTNDGGLAGALQGLMSRLIAADHALADIAIHQAISAGGAANLIAQAQNELAQGDSNASAGKYTVAIENYSNAWQHAQQAMKK